MSNAIQRSEGSKSLDMRDQNGLRGVLSIWIVVFHCLMFDHNPIDIQGSSVMPLFFLLSGFSLTIGYYSKFITSNDQQQYPAICARLNREGTEMSFWKFMYLRLTRVLPVYYICNVLCLPAFFHGFGSFDPANTPAIVITSITTFIPVCTWFGGYLGMPFDGPAWTICTLIGMWMFFPTLLRWMYNYSDIGLLMTIRNLFWAQFLILIAVFLVLLIATGGQIWPAFVFATMHPLSRLPVFAMGIAAGILSLRHPADDQREFTATSSSRTALLTSHLQDNQEDEMGRNELSSHLNSNLEDQLNSPSQMKGMPWFKDGDWYLPLSCLFTCCSNTNSDGDYSDKNIIGLTSTVADSIVSTQGMNMLLATSFVVLVDILDRYLAHGPGVFGAVWLQALNPFAQLSLIVAMTRCQSNEPGNWVSSWLRLPLIQWLGDLSMSVYLVHWMLAYYLIWAVYGHASIKWAKEACDEYDADTDEYIDCAKDVYRDLTWPDWSFVVLPILSVSVAFLLFTWVEKPISKLFRGG